LPLPLEFRPEITISEAEREAIGGLVGPQKTLEDVVRWGLAQRPRRLIESVVVQDEYSHDVVIAHSSTCFLVYDTT